MLRRSRSPAKIVRLRLTPSEAAIGERLWEPARDFQNISIKSMPNGGQGGIRTHGELPPTTVFKTVALNHSATCPRDPACAGIGLPLAP